MKTLHNLKRLAVIIASCSVLAGCTQVSYTIIIPDEGTEVVITNPNREEIIIEQLPFEFIVDPELESQEKLCR